MPYLKGKQSVLIRKHFEDRESWLEGRQELGIGGSDAAAVCGLSPWTSPVELWKIKTGQKKGQRYFSQRGGGTRRSDGAGAPGAVCGDEPADGSEALSV